MKPDDDRQARDASRAEYEARVNRVIDHIEAHLREALSLKELAQVACFSPYHFHRVFAAMTGETLGQFVQRLRVEKAARRLIAEPHASITEIALDCGFSSSATFARSFKAAFGVSGTAFRERARSNPGQAVGKMCNAARNPRNAWDGGSCYLDRQAINPTWRYSMPAEANPLSATIEVKELPELDVVYVRHVGPYGQTAVVPEFVEKVQRWARARDLVTPESEILCVAHDSPKVTDESKLRLSVCMTVPAGTKGEGEVGAMRIAGGKYAVARFDIPPQRIAEAWNVVVCGWLPESGYQPDDRRSYEVVRQSPREHPEGRIMLDICVPVRPL